MAHDGIGEFHEEDATARYRQSHTEKNEPDQQVGDDADGNANNAFHTKRVAKHRLAGGQLYAPQKARHAAGKERKRGEDGADHEQRQAGATPNRFQRYQNKQSGLDHHMGRSAEFPSTVQNVMRMTREEHAHRKGGDSQGPVIPAHNVPVRISSRIGQQCHREKQSDNDVIIGCAYWREAKHLEVENLIDDDR